MMKIIGAIHVFPSNLLQINCDHDEPLLKIPSLFMHPANKKYVYCEQCGDYTNIEGLRKNIKPGDIKL